MSRNIQQKKEEKGPHEHQWIPLYIFNGERYLQTFLHYCKQCTILRYRNTDGGYGYSKIGWFSPEDPGCSPVLSEADRVSLKSLQLKRDGDQLDLKEYLQRKNRSL